jgi:hypothetical protein
MRNMKLCVAVSMFLCLLALTFKPVQCQNVTRFRLPRYELYAPAKIIVNFVYTNNVTVNVRTLGTSLYKVTTSPVQIVFEAEAFDVYTIDVNILYGLPVNQTIVIGLYEGGRATKGIELDTTSETIQMTMKVSVVEAPKYATAEEIAQSMWNMLQGSLNEFMDRQQVIMDEMGRTMTIIGALAVISFAVCIVALVAVFYMHRRVAELSEWGIRHETEHRGKGG